MQIYILILIGKGVISKTKKWMIPFTFIFLSVFHLYRETKQQSQHQPQEATGTLGHKEETHAQLCQWHGSLQICGAEAVPAEEETPLKLWRVAVKILMQWRGWWQLWRGKHFSHMKESLPRSRWCFQGRNGSGGGVNVLVCLRWCTVLLGQWLW